MTTYIERKYVLDTYNVIANEFSNTRYHVWNFVKQFLWDKASLYGLDVGCGNGKNMIHDNMVGVDCNQPFLDICTNRGKQVLCADCCELPFRSNSFDYCMCISVVHHLSSEERRKNCVMEMIRVMKRGSSGVFNMWSLENQEKRQFVLGENYVEWKSRDNSKETQLRFYYIMDYDTFMIFINHFNNFIDLIKIENEKGNWIVYFVKK